MSICQPQKKLFIIPVVICYYNQKLLGLRYQKYQIKAKYCFSIIQKSIMKTGHKRQTLKSDSQNQQQVQQDFFRSRQKKQQQTKKRRQQLIKSHQIKQQIDNKQPKDKKEQSEHSIIHGQKLQENLKQQNHSSSQSFDMFAQDIQADNQKNKKIEGSQKESQIFTDESGYYNVVTGKIIGKKYRILQKIGKGVFGNVVKVIKIQGENIDDKQHQDQPQYYAIKILRKNTITQQSGIRQFNILNKISSSVKKANDSYILRVFGDMFYEQGHACFVCQLMGMDLRSYTHKNQNKITLAIMREYAVCMFMGLHQMRKNKIVHADIKPDNFLLSLTGKVNSKNEVQTAIKLSDFGTSYSVQQHNMTDQLVARYYRAPQIVLGTQSDRQHLHSIDTWAVGCSLYQIFTGQFLFNPISNNELLKQIMETRGKFSIKMLKKSQNFYRYFDDNYNFIYQYVDKNTKQQRSQKVQVSITAERDLGNLLKKHKRSSNINIEDKEETKKLQLFRDLLERCLVLNPKDRITPKQALMHPFISYQVKLD